VGLLVLVAVLVPWALREALARAQETGQAPTQGEGTPRGVSQEEWKPPEIAEPIVTEPARVLPKGVLEIKPTWLLEFVTDEFNSGWRRLSAGGNFINFKQELELKYGLGHNWEVSFEMLTYTHRWASAVDEPGPQGQRAANFGGIGDLVLSIRYEVIHETRRKPTVTAQCGVLFPTGHSRHLNPGRLGTDELGGGAYGFIMGLDISKWLKPFILYGNFRYVFRTDFTTDELDELGNPLIFRNHPRDVIIVNLAAEYILTHKWILMVELLSSWEGGRLFGQKANLPPENILAVLPGIKYLAHEKLAVALGIKVDLLGKNTAATIGPIGTVVFHF